MMTIGKTLMKIDLLAGLENTAEIPVFITWGSLVISKSFKVLVSLRVCSLRILLVTEPQSK